MANLLQQFRDLLPHTPLLVGTVAAVTGSEARIVLDDGSIHVARGAVAVDDRVYFRPGGAIEGEAPAIAATLIEI